MDNIFIVADSSKERSKMSYITRSHTVGGY